jgi:5-methylcytosine-specific restriction endonuclease McrA
VVVTSDPQQPDRRDRLVRAVAREGDRCFWCRRPFSRLVPPTTDHLIPRVRGGPSWQANEVAACRRCNAERGHRSPSDWLTACEERGWEPDRRATRALLVTLAAEIARRGGHRTARDAVDAQLRRLPAE